MQSGEHDNWSELAAKVSPSSLEQLSQLLKDRNIEPESAQATAEAIVRSLAVAIEEWIYFSKDLFSCEAPDEGSIGAKQLYYPSDVVALAERAERYAAKLQQCLNSLQNWNERFVDFNIAGPRRLHQGVAQYGTDLEHLQLALKQLGDDIREQPHTSTVADGIRGFQVIGSIWEEATKAPLPCSAKKNPPSPLFRCLQAMIDEIDPSGKAAQQFTSHAYVRACRLGGSKKLKLDQQST